MATPPINRTAQAYRHLRDAIFGGRWEAGETLSTAALAGELSISRTPMLHALKRLENEGLVDIVPQVGVRIVGANAGSVAELFAMRAAVEGLAAEAAAARITADELAELEVLLHQHEQAVRRGDRRAADDLDARLHLRVADASRSSHVIQAVRAVWSPLRYQLARLPDGGAGHEDSVPEHHEVVEALRRGTCNRARAAAERHAALCGTRVLRGPSGAAAGGLVHEALVYGSDEGFADGAGRFAREGLERGERLLVVTTPRNAEVLRDALGPLAGELELRASDEWYHVPSHALLAYERYIAHADAPRVRIVGEPTWDRQTSGAIQEWARYESILNVELATAPASILCPYDERTLPDTVVAFARQTHTGLRHDGHVEPSADFEGFRSFARELDMAPFEEPVGLVATCPIGRDLRDVRRFALEQAHAAGVSPKRLVDSLLAVQEVAANVIEHGGGHGVLRAWRDDDGLVYEVRDDGPGLTDPLVGHMLLDLALRGKPRGLWIARLLSDLVEVRSRGDGLAVRIHIGLD